MDLRIIFLILMLFAFSSCQPDNVTSALQELQSMPQCGFTCVMNTITKSNCSMTNVTCTCTDEWFISTTEACVLSSCNVTDALTVARTNAEICNTPRRSKKNHTIAVAIFCALAFFADIFRLYSRWYLNSKFDVDDWVMIVVAVLLVPFQVIGEYSNYLAFGVDTWYVPPDDLTFGLQFFYVSETFYLTLLALTKISILFFFLRIFPNENFRILCWVVMAWVAVSSLLFILLQIFQCLPVDAIWRSWKGDYPGDYHCLNVNSLVYAAAGCSMAQDLAILVLPLPLILRLNTTWRHKAAIVVMFSLGVFVLVMSCIRLRYLIMFARSTNPTWDYFDTSFWSGLEVAVSVIAASLPAIRLYLVRVWPRVFSSDARKASAQSSGDQSSEGRKWAPLGLPGSSGESNVAARKNSERPRGFASRFLPKKGRRNERDADVTELELGDTVRGSVQTNIGAGHPPVGAGNFSHYLPSVELTGGHITLGMDSRASSHDSIVPINPGIRVKTTTTRTMEGDQI